MRADVGRQTVPGVCWSRRGLSDVGHTSIEVDAEQGRRLGARRHAPECPRMREVGRGGGGWGWRGRRAWGKGAHRRIFVCLEVTRWRVERIPCDRQVDTTVV